MKAFFTELWLKMLLFLPGISIFQIEFSVTFLFSSGNEAEVEGTLSVQPQANPVIGFEEYFLNLTVHTNQRNPWFTGKYLCPLPVNHHDFTVLSIKFAKTPRVSDFSINTGCAIDLVS